MTGFCRIDIDETFHSVAISLNTKIHHSFSVENLIQFFGRSRKDSKRNTFTLGLGQNPEINHKEILVPMPERKKQLLKLIKYIEEKIVERKDKTELLKAIAKTESSLIYENDKGKPAINWLLEDLENYENQIVDNYRNNAQGLLEKLNERFIVQELPYDSEFETFQEKKSDLEKVIEKYQNFIENLNDEYSDYMLISKFKNTKMSKRIRAAAFWFNFGRKISFTSEQSRKLAIKFSGSTKSFQESSIIITALRVYFRHEDAFLELVQAIEKSKTNQDSTTSLKVLDKIKENQTLVNHFRKFLFQTSSDQNISVVLRQFFGLVKSGNSNPKFSLKDVDLTRPNLVFIWLKGIEAKKAEIKKSAITKGVSFNDNKLANFIDEEFN